MDLPTLWFALAVTCWVLFFVLEGFDFGVGVLAGALGRDDHERGAGVTTIGPVWDGNEVWLVAAVGVTFAAFPDWYAALMSGLYLPFVLILLALAARGVALEFRSKGGTARWRGVCDAVLAGSSLLVAALWGAVLGVLATGLALGADGEVVGSGLGRSVAPLVSTPALLGAALGLGVALVQGATFLGLRTTGPLRARARVAALGALVPVAVLVAVVAPLGLVAVGVPAVLVAARREVLAFAATSVAVAGGVVAVLAAHLPVVLPSTLDPAFSLTVAGAAASPGALRLITIAAVLVLPGVVAYQAFSYWVFRRRVASERVAT
ncbi:cytochrome d ubiquinol oxidase subunit II [Actinomycetospora callitridis]|uniref:cytochrome d ubiquinol oxidase subunit II n=1 Tax=Actinomycetospora callitridis TaxID=913944 RepID=UPI0023655BC3|nr:cytochrome d ubiquinol oxidase subunit II [Actinomycetospora callitridis]MDD7916754.1 cytochrome d ubiquinol oxidase subunit II [Actinomycetospora callitridis]